MGLVRLEEGSAASSSRPSNTSGLTASVAAAVATAAGAAALARRQAHSSGPGSAPVFAILREGPALGPAAAAGCSSSSTGTKRKLPDDHPPIDLSTAGGNAGEVDAGAGGLTGAASGTAGVDVLSVKRRLAPIARAPRRACVEAAVKSAGSSSALEQLNSGFYARTSEAPRRAVLATAARILKAAGHQITPLTNDALAALAAALKDAGYRSAKCYLLRAKQEHVRAGHSWPVQMEDLMKQCIRSVTRGLGVAKTASAFSLSDVGTAKAQCADPGLAVVKGGMVAPFDAVIVAASWMMRGLEAATVLGEQVVVDADESKATIELGPTKMNPDGRSCPRSLVCSCTGRGSGRMRAALCPVHALLDLLAARSALGLESKHSLLCSESGHSVTSALTIASLRAVSGDAQATEHSMRRAGAQYYARSGVMLFIIQFLGRWGSAAVERYVGNAFIDVAAAASLGGKHEMTCSLASCSSSLAVGNSGTEDTAAAADGSAAKFEAWWETASSKLSEQATVWHKAWQAAQDSAQGGVKRFGGTGVVHRVVIGDPVFPLETWSTRCGWMFGTSQHVRVGASAVDCRRCINYGG
jgi:hypothetical protein